MTPSILAVSDDEGEDDSSDGLIYASVSYSEEGRFLSLGAIMHSSSGNFDSRIYFTVNESNYDMVPYRYVEGDKNYLLYSYTLAEPDYGIYTIKFFQENSTDTYEYEKNFTVNITEYQFDAVKLTHFGVKTNGNTNNKTFYAYWNNEKLTENIVNVRLNINGTYENMSFDNCAERYFFTKDFGLHDSNTYNYSIAFSLDDINYQTKNKSFSTYNHSETSEFNAYLTPKYNPNSLDFNVQIIYKTWQNVEPTLILEIDGINQTLEPKFDIQNFYPCGEFKDIDWTTYQKLGFYNITGLTEGVNHTINAYGFDGKKWYSRNILDNETLILPPVNEDFKVEVLKWNVTTDPVYTKSSFNIDINVSCPYVNMAYWEDKAYISLYGPWLNKPIFRQMNPYDWNDYNFSDGKLYKISIENWEVKEVFGELTAKFDIFYHNLSYTDPTAYGHYNSSNFNFSISKTPTAEFGIKKQDWFLYENNMEYTYPNCEYCDYKSSSYYLYRVADVGYELGVNYIDLEFYQWDKCKETWIYDCPDYNSVYEINDYYNRLNTYPDYLKNVSMRIWINVGDNRSIDDWIFLPKANVSDYLEGFASGFYEKYLKISSTSVEFSAVYGDANFRELTELDTNGYLKTYSISYEVSKHYSYNEYIKLLENGNGDLPTEIPKTSDEKSIGGVVISILLLVFAISLGSVVMIYKTNKYPKFNEYIDKKLNRK
ncbi:MAG: hypothetical protein ACTSWX_11130 [Promethearchaeota archaeon]